MEETKTKVALVQVFTEEVYDTSEEAYKKIVSQIGEYSGWESVDRDTLYQLEQAVSHYNWQHDKQKVNQYYSSKRPASWKYILVRFEEEQNITIKVLIKDWLKHQKEEEKRREAEASAYEKKLKKQKEEREKKRVAKLAAKYNLVPAK